MAFSLTQFANVVGSEPLSAIDGNTATLSAAAPIACSVSGTNALTLTPNAVGMVPSTALTAYVTNMTFSGIASGSNGGGVTATVGSLGVLNVYKGSNTGPVALTGGEIVAGCAFTLRYDAALNSGAGGFHVTSNTSTNNNPVAVSSLSFNSTSTITNLLSGNTPTLTFTATPGLSVQDQSFTLTALAAAAAISLPAPGDFIMVSPPSLPNAAVSFQGYTDAPASLNSTTSVVTVHIRLLNLASASLASNSGIYRYSAMRQTP